MDQKETLDMSDSTVANCISALSLAVSAAAFIWSLWNGRRTGEAALAAKNADERAEEAINSAKAALALLGDISDRDKQKLALERAKLEAGQVAERWRHEIARKAKEDPRLLSGNLFAAHFKVTTDAERYAVDIIRGEKAELGITSVDCPGGSNKVTFAGWKFAARQRLKR